MVRERVGLEKSSPFIIPKAYRTVMLRYGTKSFEKDFRVLFE